MEEPIHKISFLLDLSENMGRPRKHLVTLKKQPCALKYYIFDIRIYPSPVYDADAEASRKIQIAGTKSLYNFARVITQAFDFGFDHFDYGDGWYFTVELKEIKQAEKWDLKPVILESTGKAPLQYPPCEDELEKDKA